MGRFRSRPGATYYDDLESYRSSAIKGGTVETRLFEIVDNVDSKHRIPWLTFVLGSGCLASTVAGGSPATSSVIDEVRRGLHAAGLSADDGVVTRVYGFLGSLTDKKLPDARSTGWLIDRANGTDPKAVPWSIAVAATLIAAIATTAFAECLYEGVYVVDRADKEVVSLPPAAESSPAVTAFRTWLSEVQQLIHAYTGPGAKSVAAYRTLLESVHAALGHATTRRLWRSQVEALTGFAWHFITDGTPIYPGWADMLLFQAANSVGNRVEFSRVPFLRRPVLENTRPLDDDSVLLERLRLVTQRSLQEDDGPRDVFYDQVARILVQQAEVRGQAGGGSQMPLATAFIASFDIELELALWSQILNDEGPIDAFAIVTPVYVIDDGTRHGVFNTELHWLWRTVTPSRGRSAADLIEKSRQPGDLPALSEWGLIDPTRQPISARAKGLPIVVHLAGAPLLDVDPGVMGLFDRDVAAVHHALLLDEHLATVQFAEDLLDQPGPGQLHKEFLRGSGKNGPTSPRFWAFVGTQLADPAIRFRLIANEMRALGDPTLQAARAYATESFDTGEEHGGVVINDWVPAAEREVFRWHGYDVVRGRAHDLIPDLTDFLDQTARRSARTENANAHGAA